MEPYPEPKSTSIVHGENVDSKEDRVRPAMQENLPAGYFPLTEEEKQLSRSVNRKLDFVLLPCLSLLYLFNGLDRGNIGNAETQGPSADKLGLSSLHPACHGVLIVV